MNQTLDEKIQDAIWIGKSLFERNKTSGSSANMSFFHEGNIYITRSGCCFGRMNPDSFAVLNMEGVPLSDAKASKEWPLHLHIYQKKPSVQAVIHTHGTYAVLWSFLPHDNETDVMPDDTPYLKMKLGSVGLIPYEKPGSKELFEAFDERIMDSDGYLLKQHGAVVPGKNLMDAFYGLEELEETAKIAWLLRKSGNS